MKRKNLLLSLFISLLAVNFACAQDTIVAWTFPSTSADKFADIAISLNATRYISCQYGYLQADSIHIDYTKAGYLGLPDKCASTTGWTNGVDSANWMVKFKTTGYGSLKLYSKQFSDSSFPGPKDFKVQYKLPGGNPWVDLTTITCASNWTAGVVNGIDLPSTCDNLSQQVSIRWILTSELDVNGSALLSTGLSKIDDIVITGDVISGIGNVNNSSLSIYPNPSKGNFNIVNNGQIKTIKIFNLLGRCVYQKESAIESVTNLDNFDAGVYFIQITNIDNEVNTSKIIVE